VYISLLSRVYNALQKSFKARVVILGGMLTILVLLLFTNTSDAYGRIVSGLISQSFKQHGWAFDVRNPSLTGLSLTGDSVVTRWKDGPIFQLTKPKIWFDALPLLFSTTLAGHFRGKLYEGPIHLNFSHTVISKNQAITGNLKHVNLALVPSLRTYGVFSGYGDVSFKKIELKNYIPVAGSFTFSLSDFKRSKEKVNTASLQARETRMINFALDSVAANLEVTELSAESLFKQDSMVINSINLLSSLGSATGKGNITELQTSPSVDISIQIILSEKGQQTVGPLLSLAPGFHDVAKTDLANLEVTLRGPLHKPLWSIIPVPLQKNPEK